MCTEKKDLLLGDESAVVILTDSVSENGDKDLESFFDYIVNSTSAAAENTYSALVKMIHKRVREVKNNKNLKVEFLHLIEREREYFKAGK